MSGQAWWQECRDAQCSQNKLGKRVAIISRNYHIPAFIAKGTRDFRISVRKRAKGLGRPGRINTVLHLPPPPSPPLLSYSALDNNNETKNEKKPELLSLHTTDPSPEHLQEMYDRMCVSPDHDLLKRLIFQLAVGTMTFRNSFDGSAEKLNISEVLLYYDSATGDVSFGVKRTDLVHTEKITFFPFIFRNLKKFFFGRILFYFIFKSIMGISIRLEYLGAIPRLPSISGDTPNTRWCFGLRNMARHAILKAKFESAFQSIAGFALKTNVASLSHEFFYPLYVQSQFTDQNDFPRFSELVEMWLELKQQNVSSVREHDSRLRFKGAFPRRVQIRKIDKKFLRYLTFQTSEYLDLSSE